MSKESPRSYSPSESNPNELIFNLFNAKLLVGVIITFSLYGLINFLGW